MSSPDDTRNDLSRLLDAKATWLKPVMPITILPPPQVPAPARKRLENWAQRWRELTRNEEPAPPSRLWEVCLFLVLGLTVWLGVWLGGLRDEANGLDRTAYIEAGADVSVFDPNLAFQAAVKDLAASPSRAPSERPIPQYAVASRHLNTQVQFRDSLAAAAEEARTKGKLLLVLNVSGDFEEARFT